MLMLFSFLQYSGFPNVVADNVGYWSRDDWKCAEGEVVSVNSRITKHATW